MSIRIPNRVVVFDYGEVISLSPTEADRVALLAVSGCESEPFWASYWRHRDGLDRGTLGIPEYWALIAADTGAEFDAPTVHALWVADFRSWW
ncbi:MAG: HAD family phosphatase, partial [Rhodoglobus sp.]|nr:HAD family phosphatase [Rhodoglobus sp.]